MTGITISRAQHEFARGFCANLPVDIVFGDYRGDLPRSMGAFDKIVLIGMFEHVGGKNHRRCLAIAQELLKNDGLFLLQVIGGPTSCGFGAWMDRYIFPNGELPSLPDLVGSFRDLYVMEDWHNFGADYDRTLMAWHENISSDLFKDQRLFRRWRYFLLTCAGLFRVRNRTQLWQIVLSKGGVPGGYRSVR